jgi:hypothetical protein
LSAMPIYGLIGSIVGVIIASAQHQEQLDRFRFQHLCWLLRISVQ